VCVCVCVYKSIKLISKTLKENYISKYEFERFIYYGASCLENSGSILLRLANKWNYLSYGDYLTPNNMSGWSLALKLKELEG